MENGEKPTIEIIINKEKEIKTIQWLEKVENKIIVCEAIFNIDDFMSEVFYKYKKNQLKSGIIEYPNQSEIKNYVDKVIGKLKNKYHIF